MGIKNIHINPDWYYHNVTPWTIDKIILSGSIKCKKLIEKDSFSNRESTWNGGHYISLAKNLSEIYYDSSYKNFIDSQYAFVIEGIDTIKCTQIENNSSLYRIISKIPMKKRYSCWKDEYQVNGVISFDKIIGIKIPNRCAFLSDYCDNYSVEDLGINLFLTKMNSVGGNFPFIDVEKGKIIDKDEIKEYILKG